MLTLSYGYKKPENTDRGPVVFPAMEQNIERLNDHNHDGTDSAPLDPRSLSAETVTLLAANWSLVGNGIYKQIVTMPALMDYDKVHTEFRLSDGSTFYPTTVRISASSFEVYINDNTQNVEIKYK